MMLVCAEMDEREIAAYEELMARSNWGRWGGDDERGALHTVTPEAMRRGRDTVRTGRVYALGALVADPASPRAEAVPVPQLFMLMDGGDWATGAGKRGGSAHYASDAISIQVHGATTHVDALCHSWQGDQLYNGFSSHTISSSGAMRLGIEKFGGLVTRGVLLDMAGFRGKDVLEPNDLITAEDVTDCAKAEGVTIAAGDAVLVRTGWCKSYAVDPTRYTRMQPGLGPSAGLFLAKRDIVLLGADNPSVQASSDYPVRDSRGSTKRFTDLHTPYLRNLGIYLLEMLALDELASDRVYEFLFCLAPLRIVGGTGSPVNPLAVG